MVFIQWIIMNWQAIVGVVGGLGGVITFIYNKKKQKIDLDSQSTDILSRQLNLIRTMLDEEKIRNTQRLDDRDKEIEEYKTQKRNLEELVNSLNYKIEKLTREIRKLEKLVNNKD